MICSPAPFSSSAASFFDLTLKHSFNCKSAAMFCSIFYVPRHRQHVPEIQVEVILRVPRRLTVRAGPDTGQSFPGDEAEALDRTPVVEVRIADPVDIGGGPPRVRSGVPRKAMRGRAVTAVCRNVHKRTNRFPEPLQAHCQECYSARNVPGKCPQRRRLPDVNLDELPQQKMAGKLDFHGGVPGGDFIKITGQLAATAGRVLPLLPGSESL